MRIIKEGVAKKAVYRGTCSSCGAEVEFENGDAGLRFEDARDQRDSGYRGTCPTPKCGYEIYLTAREVPA